MLRLAGILLLCWLDGLASQFQIFQPFPAVEPEAVSVADSAVQRAARFAVSQLPGDWTCSVSLSTR